MAMTFGALAIPILLAAISPERLRSDLEQGERLFRRHPDPAAATAYAGALAYVDVEWEGQTIAVRDPWLTDAVRGLDGLDGAARKKRLDEIAAHLAARAAQVDADLAGAAASASPRPTPADPQALLDGILEQQQFHTPAQDPKLARAAASLRDRVRSAWKAFTEFLSDLFNPEQKDDGWWGTFKRLAVLGLSALGLGLLAWFVIRTVLRAAVDSASATSDEPGMPEAPPAPAVMAAEAQRLTASGDLRGAVRALYLALLGSLHREGLIVYDRHRTNREYLRAWRGAPDEASPAAGPRLEDPRRRAFADAVEVFDRKWYGKEACTQEELEAFESACARAAAAPRERSAA